MADTEGSSKTISYSILTPVNNPTGNPSQQGYKEIKNVKHGSISDFNLGDDDDSTDTEVDPNKNYYIGKMKSEVKPAGSASRSTDDSGQRGGGSANTGEADGNRSKLLEKALDYIKHHYKPDSFEATVKAIDVHLLDPTVDTIEIGDVVKVVLADGTEKRGTCLKIRYDLMAPENTEYTIGDAERALS